MSDLSDSQLNIKEHPDLYRKSIKGGYWVIALRAAIMLLAFAKSIIIAHFFFLDNLGIISVALMMMDMLSTFTQTGFDTALVQKKGNIHAYLDTAWTAGFIKGVMLFLILFFSAPILAMIRVPEDKIDITIAILRAMSFCFLIRGVQNIGAIFFQKELQFGKVFVMSLASSLTDIFLSVLFIYVFRSIWGVIVARLLSEAAYCAGSYILSAYRPRFHFELAKARELWKFGKWIYGQTILGYLMEMGDNFFVWFYLGISEVALYKYAYNFSSMPFDQINTVFLKVLFPAYSKMQDDWPRLREAYYKALKATALIIVPICFLIFDMGPVFVRLFLPERMYPMTLAVQILAIKGLLKSIGSTRVPFFQALGKPDILLHLMWIRVITLFSTIYFFTQMWGITGTAISTTLVNVIVNPVALVLFCRIFKFNIWKNLQQSILPCCAAMVMITVLFSLRRFVLPQVTIVTFFALIAFGLVLYAVFLWLLDSIKNFGYRQIMIEQIVLIMKKLK